MDIEITLPSTSEKTFPIFITSPCNHSGGALLQRAVCGSQNGFCFGDNFYDEISSLVDWAGGLIDRHKQLKDSEEMILNAALDRQPKSWMPELSLPFDLYIGSLLSVVYNLPFTAQTYIAEIDREIWMTSRASISSERLDLLLSLFPKGKAIFIYRNPVDMVRDAMRDNPEVNIRSLCATWNTMMHDYLKFSHTNLLKIRYEDATEQTPDFIAALEDFTAVKGLQKNIIQVSCEAEIDSSFELNSDLTSLVGTLCEDMLAVYYPMK
jgi:hypothetical protein